MGHFVMLNLCILLVLVGGGTVFRGVKLFRLQLCQVSCAFFFQNTCFSSNGNEIWIRLLLNYSIICILEIL